MTNDFNQVWQNCINIIKDNVSPQGFKTWFEPIKPVKLENKVLFKEPSNFSQPIARLEKGRLLIIEKCENNWCNVSTDKFLGWIKNNNVWGYTR